eukprot:CAMPEP_0113934604 /NCGR_PEP_ID=MMETSP1339-20121228/1914_1 /TAXON_ID=94617 /ORGANISM="Fibrocapsa japonica" /LENGTH=280 /DNA_ID=CAMNT_0000936473 /DNA_START=31 /DNA_END=870 /DNA_ORIENTATION=- /assembly_acc=CAM_ASM_000762
MAIVNVKFCFKDEVRRARVSNDVLSLVELKKHAHQLFGLNEDVIKLKYCDDDGELVTIGSDGELTEALSIVDRGEGKAFRVEVFNMGENGSQANPTHATPMPMDTNEALSAAGVAIAQAVQTLPGVVFPVLQAAQAAACRALDSEVESSTAGSGPEQQEVSNVVHRGVTCDVCGVSPITGARFKCAVRDDFDLCQECEAKDTSPHPYLKIKTPDQAPAAVLVVLNEDQPDSTQAAAAANTLRDGSALAMPPWGTCAGEAAASSARPLDPEDAAGGGVGPA